MIRDQWSDVDITAYLDDKLELQRRRKFESALAQDRVLRQRVETLRKTIAVLRETPLRETPRHYLLTPSMVEDPKPVTLPKRRSVGFMRLATSLTAAAFVLTMGLNVLSRVSAPAAMLPQTEGLQIMQFDEAVKEEVVEMVTLEAEEPALKIAADTPEAGEEPVEERAFAVEEPVAEMESETPVSEGIMEASPESDLEPDEDVGIGGGR